MKNLKPEKPELQDKVIKCGHCRQEFVWTKGEQEFYEKKRLSSPTKCPICRAIFKTAEKDNFRGKMAG